MAKGIKRLFKILFNKEKQKNKNIIFY